MLIHRLILLVLCIEYWYQSMLLKDIWAIIILVQRESRHIFSCKLPFIRRQGWLCVLAVAAAWYIHKYYDNTRDAAADMTVAEAVLAITALQRPAFHCSITRRTENREHQNRTQNSSNFPLSWPARSLHTTHVSARVPQFWHLRCRYSQYLLLSLLKSI